MRICGGSKLAVKSSLLFQLVVFGVFRNAHLFPVGYLSAQSRFYALIQPTVCGYFPAIVLPTTAHWPVAARYEMNATAGLFKNGVRRHRVSIRVGAVSSVFLADAPRATGSRASQFFAMSIGM